jgi:hypothetical protein
VSDSGISALDDIIERLKALGASNVGARVALKAAPLVDEAIKKTASAGQTPSGTAWQPKKDGSRPLVNAAAAIQTRVAGNYILTTLRGPTVFHHKGLQGKPHRQVIPDSGAVPEGVKRAVTDAAREVFEEITKGRA